MLGGLMIAAWPIDAAMATQLTGRSAWAASASAAAICWASATLSLILSHLLRLRGSPVAGLLLGMVVRMTIPLVIALVIAVQRSAMLGAGLAAQLVVFYLLALTAETALSLMLAKSMARTESTRAVASQGSAVHG